MSLTDSIGVARRARGESELARLAGAGDADQRRRWPESRRSWPAAVDGTGLADALTMCTASTPWEWPSTATGLAWAILAEAGGVDQRAELGQRDASTLTVAAAAAPRRAGFGFEAEQVDRASGGGEQVGGHRRRAVCAAATWPRRVASSAGSVVWSASATGHGVDWPAKASAWGSPLSRSRRNWGLMGWCSFFYSDISCDRCGSLNVGAVAWRPSQRLVAVVFGGAAHALLVGEQAQRFDDGLDGSVRGRSWRRSRPFPATGSR